MGIDPVSLGIAGFALSAVGTGVGVLGSMQQASASKAAADYQAKISDVNAQINTQNASYAAKAGEAKAFQQEQRTRAGIGEMLATQASSGVDVTGKSASDIRTSQAEIGALDSQTIRSNAARQAYGLQTAATNDINEASAQRAKGDNAMTTGYIDAFGGMLRGAGSAAANYAGVMGKASGIGTGADAYGYELNNVGRGTDAYTIIDEQPGGAF